MITGRDVVPSLRAIAIADALSRSIVAAYEWTVALDEVLWIATDLDLDEYLARNLAHHRLSTFSLVLGLEQYLAKDFARDHVGTLRLIRYLSDANALALVLADDLQQPRIGFLVRDLARVHFSNSSDVSATRIAWRLGVACRLARRLARSQADALVAASDVTHLPSRAGSASVESKRGLASVQSRAKLPLVVLALAIRVLPACHRGRYWEEFLAELVDHPSWPTRMSYAARLTFQMWRLRRILASDVEMRPERTSRFRWRSRRLER